MPGKLGSNESCLWVKAWIRLSYKDGVTHDS
jgi:hypothetical protein